MPLEAGTYTLTAGFNEWWGVTRPMTESVTIGSTTVAGTPVNLTPGSTAGGTVAFTLAEPATVTYTVAKGGSSDPVISWLGVAKN